MGNRDRSQYQCGQSEPWPIAIVVNRDRAQYQCDQSGINEVNRNVVNRNWSIGIVANRDRDQSGLWSFEIVTNRDRDQSGSWSIETVVNRDCGQSQRDQYQRGQYQHRHKWVPLCVITLLHRVVAEDGKCIRYSTNDYLLYRWIYEKVKIINEDQRQRKLSIYYTHRPISNVILSIARIYAYDIDGNPQVYRVLLDPRSQSNLMTESFTRKLRLQPRTKHQSMRYKSSKNSKVAKVRIESIHEKFVTNLE